MALSLNIGDKFTSLKDFDDSLKKYQIETRTQFYKRDAKTLKMKEKDLPKASKANKDLKYYYLRYTCIHGGQQCRKRTENPDKHPRGSQGTWRQGCPAEIKIILTEDGQELLIKELLSEHNHEIPELKTFQQLPQQRRLTKKEKEEAAILLSLKANKKLVQAKLVADTGKNILLRDLSNINLKKDKDELQSIVSLLNKKYDCTVDLLTTKSDFKGMFFQSTIMKETFKKFPEMIFMDGTYKLINIRCPVYIIAVENSLGLTDIVGIGLLMNEDVETVDWMVQKFKERNSDWTKIKVAMTDKDATERNVIQKQLPQCKNLICMFHVLQIFRREITSAKLSISPQEVATTLKYLQNLAYSSNEIEYNNILAEFKKFASINTFNYYLNNWHNIRINWVVGFTYEGNFYNNTNNRLESFNSKLKSVITAYSTITEFIEKLFILLQIKKSEFDNKISSIKLKINIKYNPTSNEMAYYKLLTPYAFQYIEEQLKILEMPDSLKFIEDINGTFCETSSGNKLYVSGTTCECRFFKSMYMPCKHIFLYRKINNLVLFDPSLCAERWTRKYLFSSLVVETSASQNEYHLPQTSICTKINKPKKILTAHEKYRQANAIGTKLATLCSEVSTDLFYERMKLLIFIKKKWENLEEFSFEDSDSIPENISNIEDNEIIITEVYEDDNIIVPNNEEMAEEIDEIEESNIIVHTQTENLELDAIDNNNMSENTKDVLKEIILPPPMRNRGRPKGKTLTTIGLPNKKKIKPLRFNRRPNKIELILGWVIKKNSVEDVIKRSKLIQREDMLEIEIVNNAIIDDEVDISSLRPYFHSTAWDLLERIIAEKKDKCTWLCNICNHEALHNLICCDSCLQWFHLTCVALIKVPKTKVWFCQNC